MNRDDITSYPCSLSLSGNSLIRSLMCRMQLANVRESAWTKECLSETRGRNFIIVRYFHRYCKKMADIAIDLTRFHSISPRYPDQPNNSTQHAWAAFCSGWSGQIVTKTSTSPSALAYDGSRVGNLEVAAARGGVDRVAGRKHKLLHLASCTSYSLPVSARF